MPRKRQSVSSMSINTIKRDLVPLIIDASTDSSEALSRRPDRYREASMGYIAWDYICNAVWEELRKSPDWRISNTENDLVLTCTSGPEDIRLRVCRVDPNTRLPTSGKRAKESAYRGPLLSEDLCDLVYTSHEFVVGYDAGILSGIGSITLQLLSSSSETVWSQTLAVLYDASVHDIKPQSTGRERLPKGIPSRRQEQPKAIPKEGKK